MVHESTTMTELLDASGVGNEYNRQNHERWYEPPKQKVYLVCKLDCPWGYDGHGQTTVKCNCRDGWAKKTKFGELKKLEHRGDQICNFSASKKSVEDILY